VRYNNQGKAQGHSLYIYRDGGWDYIVKSNAWTGLAIDTNGHAYFEGKCVAQKYNPATGELVWSDGNYKFRVDVWDNTPAGGTDVYQIKIMDKNGVAWHKAGYDPYGVLKGGEIVVHLIKKAGSASIASQPASPGWLAAIVCLLAVGLLLSKGLVALARKPSKISQMLTLAKERGANRDRSSIRMTLRLPCTLAELG